MGDPWVTYSSHGKPTDPPWVYGAGPWIAHGFIILVRGSIIGRPWLSRGFEVLVHGSPMAIPVGIWCWSIDRSGFAHESPMDQ